MVFKIKTAVFKIKKNPKNGDETKSDIFPWDKLKSDIIFQWL